MLLLPAADVRAQETVVDTLLRLHHEARVAHVLHDAGRLTAMFDDSVLNVSRGRLFRTPAGQQEPFASYLASVRFLEWDNARPPVIRLSPGGAWAEVVIDKRVRLIPADTTTGSGEEHVRYAWLERWRRTPAGWRLATVASTDRPGGDRAAAPLAARVRAYEILARARRALGGDAAVAAVATLRFDADGEGPGGPFRTQVLSAVDGRVRFTQTFPDEPAFAAGVSLAGGWQRVGRGPPTDSLGAVLATVVHGHEMHLAVLAPEARYTAPAAAGRERVNGRDVEVVRFHDALGAPVDFLHDAETGRPAGFRPVNHTGRGAGDLLTWFDDWRRVGEVLLPFAVTITQGSETYRYRIIEASVDWIPDAAFWSP